MEKILVFGHKNPDTDTICSSIVMADLQKKLNGKEIIPCRLGNINEETNYALEYFNVEVPELLEKVEEQQDVILVDHNEFSQSVDGIENARIIEVVDHHRINNFQTAEPLFYYAQPVGCTSTMIYDMYKESNVKIPKNMAGLMLSAILSDTLLLTSPTTTESDRFAVSKLAKIAGVDVEKYGIEMLKAASSIEGMSVNDLIKSDFKSFVVNDKNLGIGQVMTLDFETINKNIDEFVNNLDEMVHNDFNIVCIFVTDIIKNGSYVIYSSNAGDIIKDAFGLDEVFEGVFIPNIVSRKKQILPLVEKNM